MSDTTYYATVAQELAEGKLDQARWLQAKVEYPLSDREAQALYVRLRIKDLKAAERAETQRKFEEEQRLIVDARKKEQERLNSVERTNSGIGWSGAFALIIAAILLLGILGVIAANTPR